VAGLIGSAGAACYCASKGAVRLMTKCLALELVSQKIRVNSVHPGVIDTHMGAEVIHAFTALAGVGDNEGRALVEGLHPMGHMGEAANVADAIVFLASDKAAFMTGSEMVVDGGWTAQ
jgi:NAD(P)-dependent dehydrogenase (short-subunit alcohol dehydrogenase family)